MIRLGTISVIPEQFVLQDIKDLRDRFGSSARIRQEQQRGCKRVVATEEAEELINKGYKFVGVLPNSKVILVELD